MSFFNVPVVKSARYDDVKGILCARKITQYYVSRGLTPTPTIHEMESIADHQNASDAIVFRWHKKFVDTTL